MASKPVNVTSYDMHITIENGCKYESATDNTKGQKSYGLHKGPGFSQKTDMKVTVIKTPDKKFDDDIKKLEEALNDTKKSDPKKYIKDIVFSFATNDDKPFAHINFRGYISEISHETISGPNLQQIVAEISIAEPATFNIKQ